MWGAGGSHPPAIQLQEPGLAGVGSEHTLIPAQRGWSSDI